MNAIIDEQNGRLTKEWIEMIVYLKLLSIVIAVSIDGLGVGMTYGMRKIRIPLNGLLIIMCLSGTIVLISMTVGHMIKNVISPTMTDMLGSFIFIGLGLFVLCSVISKNRTKSRKRKNSPSKKATNVNPFTSILSDPTKADKDQSGIISTTEAFVLGTALALDAFAAGLGASMLGYSPFLTAILIAAMSGLFLYTGLKVGLLLAKNQTITKLTFVPPLFLIGIGVYHLL